MLDDVRNRMLQNEYILQIALYEGLMRDIQRSILAAEPTLLRPDRKIDLGRLVATGRERVIKEEIEREVQGLDRKNVADKERYFRERLCIDWFGGKIVPLLGFVIDIRNDILHENPDRKMSEYDMGFMHTVTVMLPLAVISQAAVLYPDAFELPPNMKADDVMKFMLPEAQRKIEEARREKTK